MKHSGFFRNLSIAIVSWTLAMLTMKACYNGSVAVEYNVREFMKRH